MSKIVFLVAEDWYFLSHRKILAEACLKAGWQVVVAANVGCYGPEIEAMGCILEPMAFDRGGINPLRDLKTLAKIVSMLRRQRPDILHSVGMKPVLYGGIAAALARVKATVSAMAGMGYLFTGDRSHLVVIRQAILTVLRLCIRLRGGALIVQNEDDRTFILTQKLVSPDRLELIPGSGVDLGALPEMPFPVEPPVVFACVSRMLRDKGILELVDAARILKNGTSPCLVRLVGGVDSQNPTSLSEEQLKAWQAEGLVEWLGHQSDIAAVWRDAHVAVLPSYREGMPKALLEAQACGRPVITTDVQGCREAIRDGVEGRLVPVRQALPLAKAMDELARDPAMRKAMGRAARQRAETRFDQRVIAQRHLDLYHRLTGGPPLVLHVITSLDAGGAKRQLDLLLKEPGFYDGLRHCVVSMTDLGYYGQALREHGVAVHCLGMEQGVSWLKAFLRLWRLMRVEKPAVVQTWHYTADLMGLAAARLSGKAKVVWNLRCSDMDAGRNSILSRMTVGLLARLSSWPSLVLHSSQAGRKVHEALGYRPCRWQHLPNGFDLSAFMPDPRAGETLKAALALPPETLVVGMVARFEAMKDHPTFIRAAGLLAATRSDVVFVLAGDEVDENNADLMGLIGGCGLTGKVFLLGQRDDLNLMTPGFDLAVLSSAFGEDFPNALGEALACGVPCVATDVGDNAMVVGEQGRLVPPGNPQALAEAMAAVLDLPFEARRRLGSEARRRMKETFSIQILAARYAALYRGLAAKDNPNLACETSHS
jgi:glycosyltransferase involved in cell wall biosynthesis